MDRFLNRILPMALYVIGAVLGIIGVLYLVTPAASLPSFLGGIHHPGVYHTKRADVALILGVLALGAAWILYVRSIRHLRLREFERLTRERDDEPPGKHEPEAVSKVDAQRAS
jgi:drug/metabolite transporter (DMT)-like permease